MSASILQVKQLLDDMAHGYKVPKILYDTVFDAAVHEVEGKKKAVLFKRDPVVYRDRTQARYVKIVHGNVITMEPQTVESFGADFDGDTICATIWVRLYKNKTGHILKTHISELPNLLTVEIYETKEKPNGIVIEKYKVLDYAEIQSINKETGIISWNQITGFSIHKNLELYTIEDKNKQFEKFWASSDHSLIIYNEETDKIEECSPKELLKNPEKKYLIQQRTKNVQRIANPNQ